MTTAHKAKQARRKRLVNLKWEKRQKLKKIVRSLNVTEEERAAAQDALNMLPKNSSQVRLRNRCKITGRPRGYLRKFQMSRICFRELANNGTIPGVFKASWWSQFFKDSLREYLKNSFGGWILSFSRHFPQKNGAKNPKIPPRKAILINCQKAGSTNLVHVGIAGNLPLLRSLGWIYWSAYLHASNVEKQVLCFRFREPL